MVTTEPIGERQRTDARPSDALLGTVTKIWTRTTTDDSEVEVTDSTGTSTVTDEISNHEASVLLHSDAEHLRRVPIHQAFVESAGVPQVNDFVRVEFLKSITSSPIITGYAPNDEDRSPLARPGHWRYRFETEDDEGLYVEGERVDHDTIASDDSKPYDVIRLAKKADGLSDPSVTLEIDDSGDDPVVRVAKNRMDGTTEYGFTMDVLNDDIRVTKDRADGTVEYGFVLDTANQEFKATKETSAGVTEMGLFLDFLSGEFKIGDGSGYGIVSDGSGNFTWYEQSVDFVDDGTTITWT